MMRNAKLFGAVLAVMAPAFSTGCGKLKARDHLNRGVQEYKNGHYPEAVEHFKTAVDLDPGFSNAHLYLATTYMSQYFPHGNSEMQTMAKDEFLKVLEQNATDKVAVAWLASIHYSNAQGERELEKKLEKLDKAKKWYQKLAEVDPNNREAYYSLGVIAWAKWYPAMMTARAKMGMKAEDPGPLKDKKVKAELAEKWTPVISDGLKSLEKSLEIDKEYDDAMACMNLLIREHADLADSSEQYKKEVEEADNWVRKALETKKIIAARQPTASGIVDDTK